MIAERERGLALAAPPLHPHHDLRGAREATKVNDGLPSNVHEHVRKSRLGYPLDILARDLEGASDDLNRAASLNLGESSFLDRTLEVGAAADLNVLPDVGSPVQQFRAVEKLPVTTDCS